MYRFLPVCLLLLACSNDVESVPEPTLDRKAVEQIVSEYIGKNPGQIARAVAIATQAEKAALLKTLADQGQLLDLGPDTAPITIIEFFDYNCGYCRRALDWVIEQLDRGDVRVIFVETPILDSRTGTSKNAALASLAAARQNRFRDMHEALMQAGSLEADAILDIAKTLELDMERFQKDMEDPATLATMNKSLELAEFVQLQGTPGFFINGRRVHGFDPGLLNSLVAQFRRGSSEKS